MVIHQGILGLLNIPGWLETMAQDCVAACAGLLLFVSLWTPIAGTVVALVEIWIPLSSPAHLKIPVLIGSLSAALAMLGPGARSLDALVFGRKRLALRER